MKLRAPPGCSALTHGGETLAVAADGSFESGEAAAAVFLAHGCEPWAEPPRRAGPRPIDALTRAEIVVALKARGLHGPAGTSTADLRQKLRRAIKRDAP